MSSFSPGGAQLGEDEDVFFHLVISSPLLRNSDSKHREHAYLLKDN